MANWAVRANNKRTTFDLLPVKSKILDMELERIDKGKYAIQRACEKFELGNLLKEI
jgi:hypothetical protein